MIGCDLPRLTPGLQRFGRKTHSQNDEDGIIERILFDLNLLTGYFVEFGVGPPWGRELSESGLEANFRLLREKGWSGLFMDTSDYPAEAGVLKERVTPFNINVLLPKHGVPQDFDLLSIDIDGQDFWVWMNLQARPRLVVIEYNASLPLEQSCVIPLQREFEWDGTDWFGASLAALDKLGQSKLYTLVYANGINAFFVRSDLFANPADFSLEKLYVARPMHPRDPKNRAYLSI
jgi:hypothetical protein